MAGYFSGRWRPAIGLLGAIVMFLGGIYFSWNDIRLAVFGVVTTAQISSVHRWEHETRRGKQVVYSVRYSFVDNEGRYRTGIDNLDSTWSARENNTLDIVYLSSNSKVSRARESDQFDGLLMSGCGLVIGIPALLMMRREQPAVELTSVAHGAQ